eukprot:scaffold166087_cov23-Tisochrysis_lutea.AAC.2
MQHKGSVCLQKTAVDHQLQHTSPWRLLLMVNAAVLPNKRGATVPVIHLLRIRCGRHVAVHASLLITQ